MRPHGDKDGHEEEKKGHAWKAEAQSIEMTNGNKRKDFESESETADEVGKRKDKRRIHKVREDDCTVALKRLCNKKSRKETLISEPSPVLAMLSASTHTSVLLGSHVMAGQKINQHLYIKAP